MCGGNPETINTLRVRCVGDGVSATVVYVRVDLDKTTADECCAKAYAAFKAWDSAFAGAPRSLKIRGLKEHLSCYADGKNPSKDVRGDRPLVQPLLHCRPLPVCRFEQNECGVHSTTELELSVGMVL